MLEIRNGMELLGVIAQIAGGITSLAAALTLLIKPIRNRVLGLHTVQKGQKCLLRSDMLRTYYHHRDSKQIRQYELENFILEYDAYKALGGNSFIDRVYAEVKTWDVLT